jgi:glutaminyl-peptide cyclotransferase
VRLLVAALVVQLVLGGAFIALAMNGFPGFGGGGRDATPTRPTAARAAAPLVPRPRTDRFDEARAFALMREQVEHYGPRPAGSQASRALSAHLRPLLPRGRFETVPGGLRNVVGYLPGRRPAVVLGAHYDTEATIPGHVGANDGAAGTAALVEIARSLRRARRPADAPELRFVLFDGEEEPLGSPPGQFLRDALRGSKAYVRAHRASTREMVLLDYIANRGVRLPREGSSTIALWERIRAAARRVGVGVVFPPRSQQGVIYDDHTPFLRAGLPAVDLIDFSYRDADTLRDTPDKLTPRSFDAVGETIVEYLRGLRAR